MCNCNPRDLARDFCNAIDSGFLPHDHNDKYYTKEQIQELFADYKLPADALGGGLHKDADGKISFGGTLLRDTSILYQPTATLTTGTVYMDGLLMNVINSSDGVLLASSMVSSDSVALNYANASGSSNIALRSNDITFQVSGENYAKLTPNGFHSTLFKTNLPNIDEDPDFDNTTVINKAYFDKTNVLVRLNEGNGIGYRVSGFDPEYFGNIGLGATDLSYKHTLPEGMVVPIGNMGATGRYAFATGGANSASGNQAVAFGVGNVASGASTLVGGQGSTASGSRSTAIGDTNRSTALNSISIGGYNNSANGTVSGSFAGESNTVGGIQSVIVGGLRNTTTGIASFIAGSQDSNVNSNGSSIISSLKATTTNNTSTIIASQNSTTNASISSIIASDVCEIGFPMYYSSIMAAKGCKILREPETGGGFCQAIIASTDATINAGQPGNNSAVKWNNAIIASFYSRINAGMSYNLTTGQGTIGTASAQLVCGMYNEDEVHLGVNNPKKKAFIVGGGGNSPLTGGTPAPEWDRKTVFYVQHNGDVYADGRIETAAGVILRSPNGTKRLVTIDDNGVLQTSVI